MKRKQQRHEKYKRIMSKLKQSEQDFLYEYYFRQKIAIATFFIKEADKVQKQIVKASNIGELYSADPEDVVLGFSVSF